MTLNNITDSLFVKQSKMPSKYKSKRPVLRAPKPKTALPRNAAISKFHELIREREAAADDVEAVKVIDEAIEDLGGLEQYQSLSIVGHGEANHRFNTAKWVMQRLANKPHWSESMASVKHKRRRKNDDSSSNLSSLPSSSSSTDRPKLLDVGGITNHYLPYSSLVDCMSIDINPQHESVLRMDLFDMDVQSEYRHAFDIIVLSLVVNFVPDQSKRGLMLHRSASMIRPGGFLYLILPSACVQNSKFIDESSMKRVLELSGFDVNEIHYSKKLVLLECIKRDDFDADSAAYFHPRAVRPDPTCNNFTISLDINNTATDDSSAESSKPKKKKSKRKTLG